jgi:diketogulonate reductase-like aldo/keto reductase
MITLNNGVAIPEIGLGTHALTGQQATETIATALKMGYRLIDTAYEYENEREIGKGIRQSGIPREQIFVTSKLETQDTTEEKAHAALLGSLNRLGLDYLDLYLIHQPYNDVFGAWRVLEDLVDKGLIRAIGVSNFAPDQLVNLAIFNRMRPAVSQIEINPYNQEDAALAYDKHYGIQPMSWSPFARGRNGLFLNETLVEIGAKYGKSSSQVVLRWHIQRGVIPIPKASSAAHLQENFDVFDFELTAREMAFIANMNMNQEFMDHQSPEIVERMAHRKITY